MKPISHNNIYIDFIVISKLSKGILNKAIGIDEKVMKMSDVRSEFSSVSGVELAQLMFSDDPTVPKLLVMLNMKMY